MKNLFALVFVLSSLCFVNLEAQNIINGPGKLLINADHGINEHLQIVPASELSENDVWQFEEVEDGNVILKCPTRGYLIAGAANGNVLEFSYHQYANTANRFKPHTKADGYKVYQSVLHENRYLGGWRNRIVLKLNSPILLKIVPSPGKQFQATPPPTECHFFWSTPPEVNPANNKVARGTIKGINYTYTSSQSINLTNNIYAYEKFPADEKIPNQRCIRNDKASNNVIEFAQPITDPVLVFASIGSGGQAVPIKFKQNIDVLFEEGLTSKSANSITGREGYAVVRIKGTHQRLEFDYLADEYYVNFLFGAAICEDSGSGTWKAEKDMIGQTLSFQSVNFPTKYIRHQGGVGKITDISSDLDKKDASFKVIAALDGREGYVSLESMNYPGYYLRHLSNQGFVVKVYKGDGSALFNKDASFKPISGLAGQGISFQSSNFPDRYIRHQGFILKLHSSDKSDLFNKDASFVPKPAFK